MEQMLDDVKRDKEALKRATKYYVYIIFKRRLLYQLFFSRHQKERATRGAETIESMSSQLAHRVSTSTTAFRQKLQLCGQDAELAEVRALLDQARDQNIKLTRAKARGEGEIAGLSRYA